MVSALGVISLASWVMIFSGVVCGQIADRSGKPDIVLYVCMAAAVLALMILFVIPSGHPLKPAFWTNGHGPRWRNHGFDGGRHETRKPRRRNGCFLYGVFSNSSPRTGHRRLAV